MLSWLRFREPTVHFPIRCALIVTSLSLSLSLFLSLSLVLSYCHESFLPMSTVFWLTSKFFKGATKTITLSPGVKLKGRTRKLLSPTSQLGFIIQRDHEWRAVVYVNAAIVHGWIKIKQVVNWVNDRWNVTTKLCELNSFPSNTERKKQEVTSKMAYLEVQKWRECILRVEYRKYRKNGSVSVVGSAICRPRVSSHMQILVS